MKQKRTIITTKPKLGKVRQHPLSAFKGTDDFQTCMGLEIGDRIHIKRTITIMNSKSSRKEERLALYRMTKAPVYIEQGANWRFTAVTNNVAISDPHKGNRLEETFYVNKENIKNFLFDKKTIGVYLDKLKQKEFIQRITPKPPPPKVWKASPIQPDEKP